MVEQVDVDGVGCDEPDVSVNPAVEIEVSRKGRNVFVGAVVNFDGDDVLRACGAAQGVCDVEGEGRVTAAVPPDGATVDEHLSRLIRSLEVEEQAFAFESGGQAETLPIPADAAAVARLVVLRVGDVPCVREVDRRPARIVEGYALGPLDLRAREPPRLVERESEPLPAVMPRASHVSTDVRGCVSGGGR